MMIPNVDFQKAETSIENCGVVENERARDRLQAHLDIVRISSSEDIFPCHSRY